MESAPARDIIVIGGSAGSIEALRTLLPQLPRSFPAAIFVVVHVLPSSDSRLPQVLASRSSLPVRHARNGDAIERGRILVAPPDHHLLLHPDHVELSRGPKENRSRPAIDPLFRSAASAFDGRTCAVVLSGTLDDGSDGVRHVVSNGGLAVIQDPDDALHGEMPGSAASAVPSSIVVPLSGMGEVLRAAALDVEEVGIVNGRERRVDRAGAMVDIGAEDMPGTPTGLTCPECHGVLWTGPDPDDITFQCRTGHRFSLQSLGEAQRATVEAAMWAALRALQEEATLASHIARQAEANGRQSVALRFFARERMARRNAGVLGQLLLEDAPEAVPAEEAEG